MFALTSLDPHGIKIGETFVYVHSTSKYLLFQAAF